MEERTRRHLAEAEADVVKYRNKLAEAEKDVEDLRAQLERHLEHKRQEEERVSRQRSEETVARQIMRKLRELDGGQHFRGSRKMTMSKDEFRQKRAVLNDQFRAHTEVARMSTQDLSDRHSYLKSFVEDIEYAMEDDEDVTAGEMVELEKAKVEYDAVSDEYFKRTAWNLQPGAKDAPASPKRTTSLRAGRKGLSKKTKTSPDDDAEWKRQRRIKQLKELIEHAQGSIRVAGNVGNREENERMWLEKIATYEKELDDLQRGGGPVNACIACNDPHTNAGRSFCGSECQRTFLLSKMKI